MGFQEQQQLRCIIHVIVENKIIPILTFHTILIIFLKSRSPSILKREITVTVIEEAIFLNKSIKRKIYQYR